MDQLSDEEVDIREEEEEEDSDKEDQDLDKMFGAWLGELDKLTQVLWCQDGWFVECQVSQYSVSLWYIDSEANCVGQFPLVFPSVKSLDDGRPAQPQSQQKAPLRQETNMANFSYRFSIYNINGQTHV